MHRQLEEVEKPVELSPASCVSAGDSDDGSSERVGDGEHTRP